MTDGRQYQAINRAALTECEARLEARDREIDALRQRADHLQLQAETHAQEARTANATINEIYQLCTGATGEPGNWHGAEPVRKLLQRAQRAEAECERLRDALQYITSESGCEHVTTGLGSCYRNGMREDAEDWADKVCFPCKAHAALATPRPKSEPDLAKRGEDAREDAWLVGRGSIPAWASSTEREKDRHKDEAAVDRFADAMKAKLAKAREKGRGGWDDPDQCAASFLADLMIGHLSKGNEGTFLDVANFCMMLHQRGESPEVLQYADRLARLEDGIRALVNNLEHEANGARGTVEGITKREDAKRLRALARRGRECQACANERSGVVSGGTPHTCLLGEDGR